MKIFVTGHNGFVGKILSSALVNKNYEVIGCDVDYFPSDPSDSQKDMISLNKDIRQITEDDIRGCDCIMHFAALSNDPLGELNSSITNIINFQETVRLARLAKSVGVERFIFSSSCSTYGVNNDEVNEKSDLAPLTAYAKSKVDSERELLLLKDENFAPIILRNATAYGISPSLRLDLVVNNLTCSAYTTGSVKLLSDGTAWRPILHIEDMANAFIFMTNIDKKKVSGEIFNVGNNNDNYTVRTIAKYVEELVPNSKIEFQSNARKDNRSYKVNFDKIKNLGFKTKWSLKQGIQNLYETFKEKNFSESDFLDKKYYRLKYIKWLLAEGKLDNNLVKISKN